MKAPLSDNEATSTEALHHHQIQDIEPEAAFDDIRRLAARICETPVALVSLVDECRQWFKMQVGMEFFEPKRDVAFCTQTILPSGALIVPDVLTDERFATNPLVTEYPQIRFFAGVPLIATNGHTLGKLCVIDYVPRELSPEQVDALWALSRQAIIQLELRRHLAETVDIRTKPKGKELICPFVHQTTKLKLRRRQDVDKSWRVKKNLRQEVDEYQNTESELILRSTLDSTANGILVVNSEGEVFYYNKKFLDMWQLPTSKFKCESKPLNIEQFCRDIVVQMQLANGNQKLINFVSQGDCKITYLDPKLLQHILTNLLSNAMKYSPTGKRVTLELSCQNRDVIFQVKDVGIGIPLVDKKQIFEPFCRGSNVDNISGMGLGLSIVKTLVELHGGQIDVESEVGLGTAFTVKLPSTIVQ